ncbi:PspA/IM30 family protein [Caulobacter sp. BK020]|uniref:PspA/IM30 family protein n=1 Tax=Caulobacter sp. BK020 TaxID=2512117 RepID=UPI0010435C87|nr:PspA/IM30 family protein [Caulobacter sp. BK020]TCS15867.1 phage shock protein A (PspA) family protein [Caulobacter sp. BK020]
MPESLRVRVGRIVAGSAHAIVDALESALPDTLGHQALRELDEAIDEVRAELGKTIAARHLAAKRLAEQSSRHDELSAQVELALSQDREDLVRAALEHQLDIEAQIPVLETAVGDAAAREAELEGYLAALQATRREMSEDLQNAAAVRASAPAKPAQPDRGAKLSELDKLARRHRVEERLAALRAARAAEAD